MSISARFTARTRVLIAVAFLVALGLGLRSSVAIMAPAPVAGSTSTIFINEIHYDNTGNDTGEFIEVAGPAGTNLTGYSIVRYNGNGGATYSSPGTASALSGTIPAQQGGYGTVFLSYPQDGLQNGAPDGMALVGPGNVVIQFLCYEGTFTATNGPALGQTCTSIGVTETGAEAIGLSLQLTGTGTAYGDFTWTGPVTASPGAVNAGQTFGTVVTDTAPTVSSTSPANVATGVASSSNIGITFSESVNATGSAFTIECPSGTTVPFTQNTSPSSTFTLDPTSDLPFSTICTVTVVATQITDADTNDPPDQMVSDFTFSFTTAGPPPPVAENVIINEIDSDTPGTDAAEFIELYDGGDGNTPLDGLVVVLFNGSNDLSYNAFDLDGKTTDANGYFVLGNAAVAGVDLVFSGLQNGQDAVALYVGSATDFPTGTAVSTVNLQDAIVYDNGQGDDAGLLVLLNADEPQVNEGGENNSIGRCPNGAGGARNTSTYSQAAPSPGVSNNCVTPPATVGNVVVSTVYGGGGNLGATLKNDYIELINRSSAPVDLSGWSVQVFSTTLSAWEVTPLTNFLLHPGQYYLVQESQGSGGTVNLPAPDASGNIFVSSTAGRVALVSNSTPLTGACPNGSEMIDFVGYGDATVCFEGSGPAPQLTNTTAALRKNNGCFDTSDNKIDFDSGAPNPRNSSSPFNGCTGLSGFGTANPVSVVQGETTTLSVRVAPGQNPASTSVTVTADLTQIGGSAAQSFCCGATVFTFNATIPANNPTGLKSLPVTITDAQSRTFNTTIQLTVLPVVADHVTISQLYGGGGNGGATYNHDYVELYNPHATATIDLTGWSLQYGPADQDFWTVQPLGGAIGPGEYYLIALASNNETIGASLPAANVSSDINMGAGAGKVALVNNFDALEGPCPISNPGIVDFLGYGSTANCAETTRASSPSSTTALFRENGGARDSDNNLNDFETGAPNPRRTAPIVEIGPSVFSTDPRNNATTAPRDATIVIDFTEPVTVDAGWYDINCASGNHNSATVRSFFGGETHTITPNVNFVAGEQCTVTIFKDAVHDVDLDDSGTNADSLSSNKVFTFTVANGTAPPYPPSVHLTMGNPNGATANLSQPNNYLMEKPELSLSYNRTRGTANWVSWHLSDEWIGSLVRVDTFRADPAVPEAWFRVSGFDYVGSGFDRGHMVPNADRDKETSMPINQATFLMTNIMPQSPDNNQGPWANLEAHLRTLVTAGNEIYIVAGGSGTGGTGSAGSANTIAGGNVTVPAQTWKVALIMPKDVGDDVARVNCSTKTLAVIMPNIQGIRTTPWENYITTVDAVETLTGYDFFANLPDAVENCVEAGSNGVNKPGTANQSATTPEDTPVEITLEAVRPSNTTTLTFSIVTGPTNGSLGSIGTSSCVDLECSATVTYTPGTNYNGPDSFTFKVNDGTQDSNTSTVTITVNSVNDDPDAVDDEATVTEESGANTINVLANDSDSDGGTLTVTAITQGNNGSVAITNGGANVSYTPNA
ncbi:MAG TPA: DNA/RNA non-specific endonuclease, partial [Pyrinomonadaceae bacterium]|nr:DNA/RNA non-specific endonuclease [Pyrinomonadaceae bacterium]